MEELLPSARIVGMDDPLTWMQAVAARLVVRPPCSPATWLPPREDTAALRWYEPLGQDLMTIFLFEKPGQVEIGVWTTAWDDDLVSYVMYADLVTTVASWRPARGILRFKPSPLSSLAPAAPTGAVGVLGSMGLSHFDDN